MRRPTRGASPPPSTLTRSARPIAEHGGLAGIRDVRAIARSAGLVARLDALSTRPGARLQRHGPPTPAQDVAMKVVDPETLPFDSDTSPERDSDEPVDESHAG